MTESPGDAYNRGVDAGVIDTRLAGHDRHFQMINGSLERMNEHLQSIDLSLQRLADQAAASNATAIATAKALADADEMRDRAERARRDVSERRWTPVARFTVLLGALVGLAGVVVAIYATQKGT